MVKKAKPKTEVKETKKVDSHVCEMKVISDQRNEATGPKTVTRKCVICGKIVIE